MQLMLRLAHSNMEFRFDAASITLIILGRADPASAMEAPTIDLSAHGGDHFGVSRRHLHIKRAENNAVSVTDQNSVNGSYLNGQRLIPHQPRILRDGDELRLGRMVIRVAFLNNDASPSAP